MPQRRRTSSRRSRPSAARRPSGLPTRLATSTSEATPPPSLGATPHVQPRVAARPGPRAAPRDYGYVLKELRMIGLISAGILAIILLLALIFR